MGLWFLLRHWQWKKPVQQGKGMSFIFNLLPIISNAIWYSLKTAKNRSAEAPRSLNPPAKSAVLVYNHLRSRRIQARPTVVQSETIISLKSKRITRLSSMAVEDSLFRYLRLCLLSMYVKAAKITSINVSTSNVFIPTSFPFPERTTADYPYLL